LSTEETSTRGAQSLLVAASLVVVIAGIKAASSLILPFLVALFLAMVTLPLLNWLQRMKIPKPLAVLVTVLVAVAVLVGIASLVGGSIKSFTMEAPKYQAKTQQMYSQSLAWLEDRGLSVTHEQTLELFNPAAAIDLVTGTLRGIAAVLSNLLLVFLIIVFILFEAAGFPTKLQVAFGDQAGSDRFENIRVEVQRYLATKTLISLTTGVLVSAAMAIIGVDFALLWGTLAFLLNYIPNLGSIIAAVPAVLLALVQLGPGSAIAVAVVFVAINVTLGNFAEPYFMGRRMGLSTLVIFISLVFWGWVWGPVGMLLSVPLTMILKIMLENTEDLRWIAVLLGPSPKLDPAEEPTKAGGKA